MMIGIQGPELTAIERKWIQKVKPAGIIYFRRNVVSQPQLKSLSQQIIKLTPGILPLIGIDQEGGKVARLTAPFTEFPGNVYLGRIFSKFGSIAYAQGQARIMARELKTIGVNYNFTPVA